MTDDEKILGIKKPELTELVKQILAEIPESLPANGGNADYAANADKLDGLHAEGFIKANNSGAYDCNTLYDAGLYLCNGSATNTPNDLKYGTLFVMPYRRPYGNSASDYCAQIFIPNGDVDDPSLWYRTSLQNSWNDWKRSCDGGNADKANAILDYAGTDRVIKIGYSGASLTPSEVLQFAAYTKSTDGEYRIKDVNVDNVKKVLGLRGIQLLDVNDAPEGISYAPDTGCANTPFNFWSTILTLEGGDNANYRQQIAFPWGEEDSKILPKYRVKDSGVWKDWRACGDVKPYEIGQVPASYSAEIQNFVCLDFTPSAVICHYSQKYSTNGTMRWATPITNGFSLVIDDTSANYVDYIAFR